MLPHRDCILNMLSLSSYQTNKQTKNKTNKHFFKEKDQVFKLQCTVQSNVMKGGVADIRDDEPYHCASITDSHHYTALNCTDGRKFMSL